MEEKVYKGQILTVSPIKSRFGRANAFEICFEVGLFADDGKTGIAKAEVYLEVSNEYGMAPMNDRTQKQITMSTLKQLGFQYGEDLSKLDTLINASCQVKNKHDKNGNDRFYFSGSRPVETINIADAMRMMKEMDGNASAPASSGFSFNNSPAPAAQPAAPQQVGNPPNPFAGM